MTQPVDRSILQEIVRIIESRKKVPERVRVRAREYLITYLEDHQRRLQDALHRYDSDRLNMLYGQLASKVKYQLLRRLHGRETARVKATRKPAAGRQAAAVRKPKTAKPARPAKKVATRPAKARVARKKTVKKAVKQAPTKTAKKKPTKTAKKKK